jgi:trk system potassium uptake protein
MIDLRPVGYLIGWLVAALAVSMTFPMAADILTRSGNAHVFATTAILTMVVGATMTLACTQREGEALSRQQGFLLTTGIWVVFPVFGALPFFFGAPRASFTDAMFEAMSAITTTGSTVFVGLDRLPAGTLLWRGMLQWFGGLGIVVVAMIFLPVLKVGGMQLFRSEAFDTLGKVLPRAGGIALGLTAIYITLSLLCYIGYTMSGMESFDAAVHAMTTVSTGGMANTDASFIAYSPAAHYVAIVFMILAALPFVRFMQLATGSVRPLVHDSQIRTFLLVILATVAVLSAWVMLVLELPPEPTVREVMFNIVSVITGTGFTSTDYNAWGPFAMTLFFIVGLVGGCSGSTVCSVKIFRYQLLFSAISEQVKRLHSPSRVFLARYEGRPVAPDVMDSVIAFFMLFYLTLAVSALLLVLVGLTPITAITGAATALANIGPGLGPEIGPVGNFAGLPGAAKWVLTVTMLLGRLEIISVLVIFTASFWRS